MYLQTYATPAEFLKRTQAALARNEAENNVILGLSLRLVQEPNLFEIPPYFLTLHSGDGPGEGDLNLAAMMTPPHNLLLYCDPGLDSSRRIPALEALARYLAAELWPVPGVLARAGVAEEFTQCWAALTGQASKLAFAQRVYELRWVTPPKNVPGSLRLATGADVERIAKWLHAFRVEIFGDAEVAPVPTGEAQRYIQNQGVYLWQDAGRKIASMAIISRYTPHGAVVSYVYTPPGLRGRGYASACVAGASQAMLAAGYQFCALFTDLANPTSNAIYQAIGYHPVCDVNEYHFTPNAA